MAKKATSSTGMPSLVLLLLLIILSIIGACILVPVIGFLADKLFDINNNLRPVFVNTALCVLLLLCIIFRNSLKANIRSSLNLPFYTVIFHFIIGVAVAFLFIAVSGGILWLFGIKSVSLSSSNISWSSFALILITSFAVELIFRGFALQSLISEIYALPAVFLTSILFTLTWLVYSQGDSISLKGGIDFLAGFRALPKLFGAFGSLSSILPALTGIFLLSALFCLGYLKLGSLYAPIGMSFFIFLVENSEAVTFSSKRFVGKEIIFGSQGTILEALPASIMAWMLLLLAIIGFLCIGGISKGDDVR